MKVCSKCGVEKDLDCFGNDKRGKDGKVAICKACDSKRGCVYAKANPQQRRAASNLWSARHTEQHRTRTREYIKKHPDYLQKWRSENPEKSKATNKRSNDKKLTTPLGRLLNRVSCGIRRSIRENKQGRHWESLTDYTLLDLKKHLEKQFVDGMSWERFPEIHIDHKIPLAAFNFEKPEDIDFKRAWGLKNLRPMWAKDNMSKGAKIEKPFQPSLQIGG